MKPATTIRCYSNPDFAYAVMVLCGDNGTGITDIEEYSRRWGKQFESDGSKILAREKIEIEGVAVFAFRGIYKFKEADATTVTILALDRDKLYNLSLIATQKEAAEDETIAGILETVRIDSKPLRRTKR